jgi:hypothetical protein
MRREYSYFFTLITNVDYTNMLTELFDIFVGLGYFFFLL